MISGTDFWIEGPQLIKAACRGMRAGIASDGDLREIQAECESERALCVSCEDGMAVFSLVCDGSACELFVWIAVAFKHGAFARQEAALLAVARDLEADTIAFRSRRRGWARRLGPEWQRRGTEEFVRRVHG